MDERQQLKVNMTKLINSVYDSNDEDMIEFFYELVTDVISKVQTKLEDYVKGY